MGTNNFSAHPIAPIYGGAFPKTVTYIDYQNMSPSQQAAWRAQATPAQLKLWGLQPVPGTPAAGAMPGAPGAAGAPGAGGAGGTPGDPATQMLTEYQKAYDEARKANEARYGEILAGYKDRYVQAMKGLEGLGNTEKGAIADRFKSNVSKISQDMVSRGLSGTTVLPSMVMGADKLQGKELGALNERLQQQRLGYQTGLSKEMLDFMERRDDTYPQSQEYINLAMALGNAGGGPYGSAYGAPAGGQAPFFFNATNGPLAPWQTPGGMSAPKPVMPILPTPAPAPAPAPSVSPIPTMATNAKPATSAFANTPATTTVKTQTAPAPSYASAMAAPTSPVKTGTVASGNRNGSVPIILSAADEQAIAGLSDAEQAAYFQKIKGVAAPLQ